MARLFSILPPPQSWQDKATHTHAHMQVTLKRSSPPMTNMRTCEWEKCQRSLHFLIHSFSFLLFFIIFTSSPSISVTPSLCCTFSFLQRFNYSSHLPRWHFNQNKSVRLFPITDCHDSSRSKRHREQKCLKALLLCLRDSYIFIYLLIILETLPSKHILQKVWCVDFRWSREIELHSSLPTKRNTITTTTTTTGILSGIVGGNNGAAS